MKSHSLRVRQNRVENMNAVSKPSTAGTNPFAKARLAYEHGAPIYVLRRRFHMSDSETQDMAPEEFDDAVQADKVSGY